MAKDTIPKGEGIRAWNERTTRKARVALVGATAILAAVAVIFWTYAPLEMTARLQTFNGAITIPAAGGIWIAAFMAIWLIPMRELSFRGQESLERMEVRIQDAIDKRMGPAIDTWQRIGDRVEKELMPKFEASLDDIKAHLDSGLLAEIREAADAIREMQGPIDGPGPDINRATASLGKDKETVPANGSAPGTGDVE